MKKTSKVKKGLLAVIYLSVSLLLPNCTKDTVPAPFVDGMYLEYKVGSMIKTYKIHTLGGKEFKIIQTLERGPLPDDVKELFVDEYGRVHKSSFEPYEGKLSPIWIPANKMKIGNNFDGDYIVSKKDQ